MNQVVEETDDLKALLAEVSKSDKQLEKTEIEQPIIDVLNLQPRTEVHKSNSKKFTVKIKSPIVRFIFVLLIISIIIFLAYYYLGDDLYLFEFN